jgi:hypothetical protein
MAANKVVATGVPQYHIQDAHGNRIILAQPVGSANVTIGALNQSLGGIVLTKQNVADLLAALTAFSTSGTLS